MAFPPLMGWVIAAPFAVMGAVMWSAALRRLVERCYRFALTGSRTLRAIQANFMTVRVTTPNGAPATFTPWFGALAHAIFFRAGSLDYFHTHVCSARTSGCTSVFGSSRVTGSQTRPGVLRVGVLLPTSGTWRLFLQCKVDGRILTAPFTLQVR